MHLGKVLMKINFCLCEKGIKYNAEINVYLVEINN